MMDAALQLLPLGDVPPATDLALFELNNAHAKETSYLETEEWRRMIASAFWATGFADGTGFLIAFDQAAHYESPNFQWFVDRRDRFVYVDRIVVSSAARGGGRARRLYDDLFEQARRKGHECIVCEVNQDPPNPGSDRFHERLGFVGVGEARLEGRNKTVQYLERLLT
ncbi:MAG: GNAT family N-acetyltransferase [Pseudomonadota bacterium]